MENSDTVNKTIRDQHTTPKFKVDTVPEEIDDFDSNAIYDSEYDAE